jgi:tight adherence protein B
VSVRAIRAGRLATALGACVALAASGTLGICASEAIAADTSQLKVSEGGGARFPSRSLVLSVPNRAGLQASQVRVSENGQPVQGARLMPLSNAGAGDFGVVLAIDVSPSMTGAPLAEAMAAARALAAQRTGMQELGIVTFDRQAKVVLPLTDKPAAIARVLANPPSIGHGAYIYNALSVAVEQLANANIAAGAVILLSDGASQGAKPIPGHNLTAASLGASATAAHAKIFTVGLRDSSYTPERMSLLARVGGGAFLESRSSQLAQVFTQIESGLTSAYVVHYRSRQPAGSHVKVQVSVEGVPGSATLSYVSSAPPPALHVPVARRPAAKPFWTSTLALVVSSLAAALMLGVAVVAFLAPRVRRKSLLGRVGEFTATEARARPETELETPVVRLAPLERMLEGARWWAQFKQDVEIARFERSAVELVAICAACAIVLALLLALVSSTVVLSLLALALAPFALRSIVHHKLAKIRKQFADQLPDHLQELASAMRAGHSFALGITAVAKSAIEPSRSEWARVVRDEQLGIPLEAALRPLAERMDCQDIEQVALVAALNQRSGGNMADVIDRVADAVRERADLRRELQSLTAQARLSRLVITALPPGVLAAIAVINPDYERPLIQASGGQIVLGLAVVMVFAAWQVMKAITDIKV